MNDRTSEGGYPALDDDREDLLAVLTLRFGTVSKEVSSTIRAIGDGDRIDHLILAAANARDWTAFYRELTDGSFRMIGTDFDPLYRDEMSGQEKGEDSHGG